ncbi:alanine racemase [Allosediminivita pacifica]|uniref:Alanine racemase n=1 Tax=Allosediminivita pacifica TaxID=1267769 RepID=A0A2T6AV63_9RHOB|nr:alanine racemase [Allosediminivita pacifica]PTX47710.1 alanine racemase [Allosediminivita pacifica]GGB13436.1 alanine racemase [Allosediminivita pacifica]
MAQPTLTIDLDALRTNWRTLADKSSAEAGAVVKADAYGLGVDKVAPALAEEGARRFFVATAEEGATLRTILGPGPEICVFNGHMAGDVALIRDARLTPMVNDIDQMLRHVEALPGHPFGIQLDTGMNRLGMEPAEWSALRDIALSQKPALIMSHLACADTPDHPMNAHQLNAFREMTDGLDVPRSLSATGGVLMGPDYHFDVTRPGIGVYGGLPFLDAKPVAHLQIPVIQTREVAAGESVGYGNTWVARSPARIATIAAGYADGVHRIMAPKAHVWVGETRCRIVGRISMDLIGVDVTQIEGPVDQVELLGIHQSVDTVADWAGTIGYEILTSLGSRYRRIYEGG